MSSAVQKNLLNSTEAVPVDFINEEPMIQILNGTGEFAKDKTARSIVDLVGTKFEYLAEVVDTASKFNTKKKTGLSSGE